MECPVCFVNIHEGWDLWSKPAGHYAGAHEVHCEGAIYGLRSMVCPSCKNGILKTVYYVKNPRLKQEKFLIPFFQKRKPLPKIIPTEYAELYKEASNVLPASPRASAALSRTCLQMLLKEYGNMPSPNLNEQIKGILSSNQLPTELANYLGIIRKSGNDAVHPNFDNNNPGQLIKVDNSEAEWCLDILYDLFDHYIVKPHVYKQKQKEFEAKRKKS